MTRSPGDRGEFEWIERLAEILGPAARGADGHVAIGDDVARVPAGDGDAWAWTVDTLVEGVHFRFDWMDPEDVGHRALAASLSDLAAAAAEPVGALVTVAGPRSTIAERLEGIYRGIGALALDHRCPILGGDLARAEGALHLGVTALGRVRGAWTGRGGARPGDELWVTGRLGAPAAALGLLRAAAGDGAAIAAARAHPVTRRLARPDPRVAEMRWIAERAPVHAAIDLSDGLSGDAGHLADRSRVRIALDADRLPLDPAAVEVARDLRADARSWALHGGEEFELLLACPEGSLEGLAGPFASRFGIPLTRVGRVEAGHGLVCREAGREIPLERAAWDHFRVAPPDPVP